MFKVSASAVAPFGPRRFKNAAPAPSHAAPAARSRTTAASTVMSSSLVANFKGGLLQGIIDTEDRATLRELYRDAYFYDSVCGCIIDIKAALPFSEWTLTGISSDKRLEKFALSLDNMRMTTCLPSIATDYMVFGECVCSLNFDGKNKVFDSIMPQDPDTVEFLPVPMFGMDPLVNIRVPQEMSRVLNDKDPRYAPILKSIPEDLKEKMRKGKIELDPATTLVIQNTGLASNRDGRSCLSRALLFLLLEKLMWRGTIDQASRRQRGIMHAQLGDEESWIPTQEEIAEFADIVAEADVDPVNAILATRSGIAISEIKRGDDFWKVSDIADFTFQGKLRALGASEAFLSGDVSVNTMDQAMSVFIENLRAFRSHMTNEIFYEKIFPAISVANDFRKTKRDKKVTGSGINSDGTYSHSSYQRGSVKFIRDHRGMLYAKSNDANMGGDFVDVENLLDYEMPEIQWKRQLSPIADQEYLAVLETMRNAGVPVTMRILAAAGGLDMDSLTDQLDDDVEIRKKLQDYNSKIAALGGGGEDMGGGMGGGGVGGQGGGQWASGILSTGPGVKRVGLLNRDYSVFEKAGFDPTYRKASGKRIPTSARGKRALEERHDRLILEAAQVINEREAAKNKAR